MLINRCRLFSCTKWVCCWGETCFVSIIQNRSVKEYEGVLVLQQGKVWYFMMPLVHHVNVVFVKIPCWGELEGVQANQISERGIVKCNKMSNVFGKVWSVLINDERGCTLTRWTKKGVVITFEYSEYTRIKIYKCIIVIVDELCSSKINYLNRRWRWSSKFVNSWPNIFRIDPFMNAITIF